MSALGASSSYLPSHPDSFQQQLSSQSAVSPPYTKQHHSSRSFVNMGSVDLRNQLSTSTSNISLDPNPGSTFAETLRSWSDLHVARWLADMKCGMHAATFRANDIRGDLLLELDQPTLKEMSITSIGDRIRILSAVKSLRQRAADKTPSPIRNTRSPETHTRSSSENLRSEVATAGRGHVRKESSRPPPLILPLNANRGENLPVLVGDSGPDSARTLPAHPVRPLPVPTRSTPNATQLSTPHRQHLPPPPPPPSSQIPPPPVGQSRTPGYTPALPSQLLQTPNGGSWDPSRSKVPRSTSPLQLGRVRGPVPKVTSPNSGRNGRIANHPYSGIQSTLQPPVNAHGNNLSPIEEAFANTHISTASNTTPPTQSQYGGTRPLYSSAPNSYNSTPPSLDDIRKKIVKFVIPDEGTSSKIDVTDCSSGHEVVEKVLKKIGKGSLRNLDNDNHGERNEDGYLSVDGWAVYTDLSGDLASEPLSGNQLLSICNAPDHPARERGLTVRKLRRFEDRSGSPHSRSMQTPKSTKRASSISILSSLGVRNPEVALSDPPSPTAEAASSSASPTAWLGTGKRPSKLRNFFGQRPPSELITSHLGEYFPSAEPNVLRTARHSMALARQSTVYSKKRQSTASNIGGGLNSRFSVSTQGSATRSLSPPPPPPLPTKPSDGEPIPRMSLSTEDGRSVDLHSEDDEEGSSGSGSRNAPQLLPPIPLEDSSFSESMEEITTASRPVSRAKSTKRLSFLAELRSQRDVSDTASLMTVDEVTAEIENRRASKMRGDPDLEGWTKVDTEPAVPADEGDEEEATLAAEEEEEELDDDLDDDDLSDDEFDLAIPSRTTNKWVKGRLIGAGSFGQVYLGMDATSGLLMAVKQVELPKGNEPNHERKKSMLSALEREIELLKVLEHDNIVRYLYSSLDDEYLNIFLEYVPGGSVATLLQNYGAFEETLVRNFVRQILRGLNYLHERDIIHRDIKGANILVDNKGGVKISDFGISKKADGNIMAAGMGGKKMNRASLQGSVFWMAPEVVKQTGHTKKADIWSVGCLVVEMLTGEHPWAQLTQMQAIFKIGSSAKPTIPTDISPEAQDFLQKTFEINHDHRPPAADLLQHPWLSRRAKKAQNAANAAAAAAAANESAS